MKRIDIAIAVLVIFVIFIILGTIGVSITPLAILLLGFPVAIFVYLLILAKRYLDLKTLESNTNVDMKTRIEMLNESIGRIEKKVEKIEKILEKVSD